MIIMASPDRKTIKAMKVTKNFGLLNIRDLCEKESGQKCDFIAYLTVAQAPITGSWSAVSYDLTTFEVIERIDNQRSKNTAISLLEENCKRKKKNVVFYQLNI